MRPAVETQILTVSAFATQIDRAVRSVGGAVIEGEIQKPQRSRGGLLFFDLTDGDSTLSCKVFGRQIPRLAHEPAAGDLVRVRVERPDFWPTAGRLSLIVAEIELAGAGELLRKRAELLETLRAEGLCDPDRWKPLPRFPRAVGLIAGKDSEGMSDVIRAIQDRFPPAHIVACPALVQGKSAPRDIIDALARLQEHPLVDVIVIARGGGSVHDLVAFDDQRLCRAVFACATPVVAAIGHTENVPVCNYVTHAAPTPSRSAELAIPSLAETRASIEAAHQVLDGVGERIQRHQELLAGVSERLRCPELVEGRRLTIGELGQRVAQAEASFFAVHDRELAGGREMLATLPHRCKAALADSVREIGEQRLRLEASPRRRNEDARATVIEQSRWLGDGIGRELADHERDYARAINRLLAEIGASAAARPAELQRKLVEAGQLCREKTDWRLVYARQSLVHVSALIEARDFRRHGYVLATDESGKPVSSVADAPVGARLELNFRDGKAEVSVEKTKENDND